MYDHLSSSESSPPLPSTEHAYKDFKDLTIIKLAVSIVTIFETTAFLFAVMDGYVCVYIYICIYIYRCI